MCFRRPDAREPGVWHVCGPWQCGFDGAYAEVNHEVGHGVGVGFGVPTPSVIGPSAPMWLGVSVS